MDNQILGDYVTTRQALQELLKEALNMKRENWYQSQKSMTKFKDHQHYKETASTNGQNNQLTS